MLSTSVVAYRPQDCRQVTNRMVPDRGAAEPHLSLRAEPGNAALAMDYVGQRIRSSLVAARLRRGGEATEIRTGNEQGISASSLVAGSNASRRCPWRISTGGEKSPWLARFSCGAW